MDAATRNKIYVQNSTGKIPKSVIAFFVTVQTVIGIDTGYSQAFSGKLGILLNRYSIFLSVVLSGIFLSTTRWLYHDAVWHWACTIKFITYALISRLMKYKIYNFFKHFHDYPEKVRLLEKEYYGFGMIIYVFSFFVIKQLLDTLKCLMYPKRFCTDMNTIYSFLMNFGINATDMVGSFMILIILYVYAFAAHIKRNLVSNSDVKSLEHHYVFLANNFEKVKVIYNGITILELFTNTPRIMVTLWTMLKCIKESAAWYFYIIEWLHAFHLIIQTCIPAVIAEMVNCQLDAINLILNEQRRAETDPEKSYEVTSVLLYIKERKLQTDIWRVIPTDLRLPVAMFSICITYFIVILQFTHLYD